MPRRTAVQKFPNRQLISRLVILVGLAIVSYPVYRAYSYDDESQPARAAYTVSMSADRQEDLNQAGAPSVILSSSSPGQESFIDIIPPLSAKTILVSGLVTATKPMGVDYSTGQPVQPADDPTNDASCYMLRVTRRDVGFTALDIQTIHNSVKRTGVVIFGKPVFKIDLTRAQPVADEDPHHRVRCAIESSMESVSLERRRIRISNPSSAPHGPGEINTAYVVNFGAESAHDRTFHTAEYGFERKGDTLGTLSPGGNVIISWNDDRAATLSDFLLLTLGVLGGMVGGVLIELIHLLVDRIPALSRRRQ